MNLYAIRCDICVELTKFLKMVSWIPNFELTFERHIDTVLPSQIS